METVVSPEANDEALRAEARRVYRRYAIEFVEALSLCPWAERARTDGSAEERYVLSRDLAVEPALEAVAELSANPELEVALVVFPRLDVNRREFERFVGRLREADTARSAPRSPVMAMAAFHPFAEPSFETPYRLVPFIRRTPDPTIQLVRHSVLESMRKTGDRGTGYVDPTKVDIFALLSKTRKVPLHERVAEANLETLKAHGLERAAAILRDITDDRDRSYAALGEAPRVHAGD